MKAARGFTLVELLVAMSLLSLVMLGFNSALRSMAQTETRVDARLQRNEQMRLLRQFLQPLMQRVDATKYSTPGTANAPGGKALLFRADSQAIQWVGVMPARPGLGGRGYFQLTLEPDPADSTRQLVVRYLRWQPPGVALSWATAETHVLVRGLSGWSVETEGLPPTASPDKAATWPRGWQARWPSDQDLPQRLRLTLEDSQGLWPPVLLPVSATVASLPGTGIFSFGGSSK